MKLNDVVHTTILTLKNGLKSQISSRMVKLRRCWVVENNMLNQFTWMPKILIPRLELRFMIDHVRCLWPLCDEIPSQIVQEQTAERDPLKLVWRWCTGSVGILCCNWTVVCCSRKACCSIGIWSNGLFDTHRCPKGRSWWCLNGLRYSRSSCKCLDSYRSRKMSKNEV